MAYDDDHFSFETGSRVVLHIVEERMYIFLLFAVCRIRRYIWFKAAVDICWLLKILWVKTVDLSKTEFWENLMPVLIEDKTHERNSSSSSMQLADNECILQPS